MQPDQNTPPAPPMVNNPQAANPYDFLLDDKKKTKKSLLPTGNSTKQRVLLVALVVFVVIVVGSVLMAFLNSSQNAGTAELIDVAKQQTEIARIASIGISKGRDKSTKNLATTTQLALATDQPALIAALKKSGTKVSTKELALSKNSKTDAALTSAEQANKFDDVFTQTLISELGTYQKAVKKAHDNSSSVSVKKALSTAYSNVTLILHNQK